VTPRASAGERLAALFAIDLRSLALFRIGVAAATLLDVALRSLDLSAHYTDRGVLPSDALATLSSAYTYVSLHFHASAHPALTALVFALHAAAALLLLLGYRTRLLTPLCWYLGVSLNLRNPLAASMAGDQILSLCLFWGIFLPLGARFSIDARRSARDPGPDALVCIPGAALLLQVCFIYWATAFLKSGELWWTGRALFYALHNELVTPAGIWLREQSALLPLLTYATLAIEGLGPFLAFVPIRPAVFRTAAVLLFWIFHASLALFMEIGLFPVFSMIAWIPFLPGALWERIGVAGSASHAAPHPHAPARPLAWAAGALLAYVAVLLLSNTAALGRPFLPEPALIPAKALRLNQYWSMFAPDPHRMYSAVNGEALLADGERIPLDLGTSARWKLYLAAVYRLPPRETRATLYWSYLARYLCRDGLALHGRSRPIASVDFVRLDTTIFDDRAGPVQRVRIPGSKCSTGP
jgi:hypothetical protein